MCGFPPKKLIIIVSNLILFGESTIVIAFKYGTMIAFCHFYLFPSLLNLFKMAAVLVKRSVLFYSSGKLTTNISL